jgi:hypothetical protein
MSTSDDVSIAYTAWTKAQKELIEAEMVLDGLGNGTSAEARDEAQRRVDALRLVADGLLKLAHEALLQHEPKA